jgi:hypothetical protein
MRWYQGDRAGWSGETDVVLKCRCPLREQVVLYCQNSFCAHNPWCIQSTRGTVLMIRTPSTRTPLSRIRARRPRPHGRTLRRGAGDSCGCAMGTRFLAAALVACTVWYAWHWNALGLSGWAIALHMMMWCLLASGIGKIVGMLTFRFRSRKPSSQSTV